MWLLIGYLIGLGRRWYSPAELERRCRRGHPWWFMLAAGTAGASFAGGDWALGVLLVLVAAWLVVG